MVFSSADFFSRNTTSTGEDVYGQVVQNGLLTPSDEIVISNGAGDQGSPRVEYAGKGRFLVIWQERGVSPFELRGRWIDANGEKLGEEQVFERLEGGSIHYPQLAGNGTGGFLSIYNYADAGTGEMQVGTRVIYAPSTNSSILFLSQPARFKGGKM